MQVGNGFEVWTLLLDGMRPEHPPDIIFDEASEEFSQELEYAELAAVRGWDMTRDTALLELLQELHAAYLQHHLNRVQTFSDAQVKFELESIAALAPNVHMRFLVDLSVECVIPMLEGSEASARTADREDRFEAGDRAAADTPGGSESAPQEACRLVLVLQQEMKNAHASLQYPPSTPPELRAECPAWIPGTTHAFDLIPAVRALVQAKLAVGRVRALLLRQLCCELSPLFVDTVQHKSASFLCQLDASFEAVLHLSLSDRFPQEAPRLHMQSVAQLIDRQPLIEQVGDLGWSAAWPVADMVSYILTVMSAQLVAFRKRVIARVQVHGATGAPLATPA